MNGSYAVTRGKGPISDRGDFQPFPLPWQQNLVLFVPVRRNGTSLEQRGGGEVGAGAAVEDGGGDLGREDASLRTRVT